MHQKCWSGYLKTLGLVLKEVLDLVLFLKQSLVYRVLKQSLVLSIL